METTNCQTYGTSGSLLTDMFTAAGPQPTGANATQRGRHPQRQRDGHRGPVQRGSKGPLGPGSHHQQGRPERHVHRGDHCLQRDRRPVGQLVQLHRDPLLPAIDRLQRPQLHQQRGERLPSSRGHDLGSAVQLGPHRHERRKLGGTDTGSRSASSPTLPPVEAPCSSRSSTPTSGTTRATC